MPPQARGIAAKRHHIFQGVRNVIKRVAGPGVLEVEQSDWRSAIPDNVPRSEVAVTDQLAWASGANRAIEPRRVDLRAPFCYCLVVGVKQPSARCETFLVNYRRPAVGPRRAGDEAQQVGPILVADEAWAVRKPDCLQVAQQHPGGLTPRTKRMPDDVAGPD
jgi:hypothetical protein